MGLVSASIIIVSFIFHFINGLPYNNIFPLDLILLSFISYFITFFIFYAVKLIGNCLELFYIISNMQIINDMQESSIVDIKQKYNNYRIMALEKVVLTNKLISIDHYADEIKTMIETDDLSNQERILCLEMHKKQFNE